MELLSDRIGKIDWISATKDRRDRSKETIETQALLHFLFLVLKTIL